MKIHRIRVERFRGIAQQELVVPERGVVVVEAPNETGKSSMLEALRFLLFEKASSKKQAIKAIQPVGRDVATVVESEISCDSYHFTCLKQFHRKPRTELEIHAPERAQLAGDEAHERLEQILDESVDRTLLDALWFAQGDPLRRLAVGDSRSLGQALDRAAGGAMQADDDGLLEAARRQRDCYLTRRGKPKAEVEALDRQVRDVEDEIARLSSELEGLKQDIERAQAIEARLAELRRHRGELEPRIAEHDRSLAHIESLREAITRHEAAVSRADTDLERASERIAERERLARYVSDASSRLAESERGLEDQKQELSRRRAHLTELEARRDEHKKALHLAQEVLKTRQRDADLLLSDRRLRELRANRERIEEADEEARKAEELLAASDVTDERVSAIEGAHEDLRRADAQLEAGSPRVEIEALADCTVEVDGEAVALAPEARHEVSVTRDRALTFPGLARVDVAPGTSLDDLSARRRSAEDRLRDACRAAGVDSRDEALARQRERARAEEGVAGRDAHIAELLGDLDRDALTEEIRALERRTAGYREARPAEPALPEDVGAARALVAEAEAAEEDARAADATAEAVLEEAAPAVRDLHDEVVRLESARDTVADQLERFRQALADARAEVPDERLDARRAEADAARREALPRLEEARAELDRAGPEQVETLADNARDELGRLDADRRDLELEQGKVNERLTLRNETGLGEKLAREQSRLERATTERDRTRRRVDAARLLHDVLVEERDRARDAYRAPLRNAIEELGRVVYAPDFEVSVDDDLAVDTRTLQGTTLAWGQLSSGAQEQLAILVGLASARLVGGGGAPLVLDDVLGYTDPQRLERMGAVLSHAGKSCQVIVLTCVPDRYRHVGDAHLVRLQPHTMSASGDSPPGAPSEHPRAEPTGRRRCGTCGEPGHNSSTCDRVVESAD